MGSTFNKIRTKLRILNLIPDTTYYYFFLNLDLCTFRRGIIDGKS